MKVVVMIPVEEIKLPSGGKTFRTEPKECEVETLIRYRRSSNIRHGYHYHVIIKEPRRVIPFDHLAYTGGRFNLFRALNPKWKPPQFPDGKDVIKFD